MRILKEPTDAEGLKGSFTAFPRFHRLSYPTLPVKGRGYAAFFGIGPT